MKKTMILAAAALVAGSALAAEVLSVNAVGFIETTCPAGEYTALSFPFDGNDGDVQGTAWTNSPIAQNATLGSKVYFWENGSWSFVEYAKDRYGNLYWKGSLANKILLPGECFLYQPAETQTAVISGEVPDNATATLSVVGGGNYSTLGYPYPAEIAWTNTAIATAAPLGAKAYFWDNGSWSFVEYAKDRYGNLYWKGSLASKVITPGEGFLYQLPATEDDDEVIFARPYDWPAEVENP